jgi:hypothetical protein
LSEINHEIGAEREAGRLLKTGQTTQYGGYKDDGYYQRGLSKQYDILTTGRYAGTTDITLNAKTDSHSNNCVYDKRTKLMWSRYTVDSVGPGSDGKLPWTTNGDGEGIFTFVAAANAAKLAGYDDWRIPNLFELLLLHINEAPTSPPDPTAFPGWPTTLYFWTSTTAPSNPSFALASIFGDPWVNNGLKTENLGVTLVRGG